MKQQIEEIIKKNLPEKMEQTKEESDTEWFLAYGFNQALSQIDTKLIADEVLKVVVEKIEELKIPNGFSEISGSYNSALDKILSILNK